MQTKLLAWLLNFNQKTEVHEPKIVRITDKSGNLTTCHLTRCDQLMGVATWPLAGVAQLLCNLKVGGSVRCPV